MGLEEPCAGCPGLRRATWSLGVTTCFSLFGTPDDLNPQP